MSFGVYLGIFILIFLGVIFWLAKFRFKRKLFKSFELVLYQVIMPKYEFSKEEMIEREKGEEGFIGKMEQFYMFLLNLKRPSFISRFLEGPPRVALEIASQIGKEDINFYVAIPKYLESSFEKTVHSLYPRAIVEKVPEDYTIFEPKGITSGCYLKLKESSYFPITTYKSLDQDPLSSIVNSMSKILPEEGVALQLIVKPLTQESWRYKGEEILERILKGESVKSAIAEVSKPSFLQLFLEVVNVLFSSDRKAEKVALEKPSNVSSQASFVSSIESKISKQPFEVNIRLLASAESKERSEAILKDLISSFSQLALYSLNSFQVKEVRGKKLKKLVYDFVFRNFNSKQSLILNSEELATIYHFPSYYLELPQIKFAKTGEASPPLELPSTGVLLLGKVKYRGEEKKVYFATSADRRRHFYLVGQTGTGKTSLLREMIRQDIEAGRGVGVIDPHGELVEATLANIPRERVEDVVLFEPFDLERPIGLNMLEYDTPEQKDFAVQEMIAIFHKLFPPEIIGPMFEHYMRNAMLALMADKENPGTLVEIPRIFTDKDFLQEKLKKVKDPMVRNFWEKEWRQTTGSTKSDMLGYVISKVGRFVENEMMRNIIGQAKSGFDLEKIMQEGKIFLANLSKGLTGEVNSALLGLILVSKMQMAAMKRARIPEEERRDFYLYIDEFQNFTTDSIAIILSEARKYRLNLILAHQYIPQLKDEIRDAVFGNVGTIGAFRVGAEDAEYLEKHFEPEFSRFDLVNLDNFNLVIKMMINNKVSSPFKIETFPPKEGNKEIVEIIKKISKLKYGKPKEVVEKEIIQRSKLGSL